MHMMTEGEAPLVEFISNQGGEPLRKPKKGKKTRERFMCRYCTQQFWTRSGRYRHEQDKHGQDKQAPAPAPPAQEEKRGGAYTRDGSVRVRAAAKERNMFQPRSVELKETFKAACRIEGKDYREVLDELITYYIESLRSRLKERADKR